MTSVPAKADPALPSLRGRTIGVLSSLLAGHYFGMLVSSVAVAVSRRGGRTMAIQTQTTGPANPRRSRPGDPGRVGWDMVDAFVVIVNSVDRAYLEDLSLAGKPLVLLSHEEPGLALPVVVADNTGGVRAAIQHLLWHGHRSIAFAGDLEQSDIRQRYETYRTTLRANGIDPDPALNYATGDNLVHGGRIAVAELSCRLFFSPEIRTSGVDSAVIGPLTIEAQNPSPVLRDNHVQKRLAEDFLGKYPFP